MMFIFYINKKITEIKFERFQWTILRTKVRKFLSSISRENNFSLVFIHDEFPDLSLRFWRNGSNNVRGIYDT